MGYRVNSANIRELARLVPVPRYERALSSTGIVHLGVGAFHRSHEAAYIDQLMESGREQSWAIRGVGVLPENGPIVDGLNSQDGLYTLVIKHADGHLEPRIIGSLIEMMHVPRSPSAVIEAMAAESTRIVSLTITEGGYLLNPVTGSLNVDHPSIQNDLRAGAEPTGAFGVIAAALALRRRRHIVPFSVMSCDNVPGNGDVARRAIVGFAHLQSHEFADWIAESVAFPNSMVDRITPVTVDADRAALAEEFGVEDAWPVVCEQFAQWVLEDCFPSGRPCWEDVGVQMVRSVRPYELMKLRMLNAGHQVVCLLGTLAGFEYCHEVCQDPVFGAFLSGFMEAEAAPTLPPVPGVDLVKYRQTVVERFSNSYVRDSLSRLCADTSDRIPKFLLPSIRYNLAHGGPVERSALVLAAWARYAEGIDDLGHRIELVDPMAKQLRAAAARQRDEPLAFLGQRDIFGDLVEAPRFVGAYLRALGSLRAVGARAECARANSSERRNTERCWRP